MRHIGTLIAAIVIAPLAWALLALGQDRSIAAFAEANRSSGVFDTDDLVRPLLCLAAAGLLLGFLGTLRFSPLGAMLIGIGYTSSYTLLLIAPNGLLDLFTKDLSVAGRHVDLTTPIRTGTALVLGVLLLVGSISVGRWRRWPRPADLASEVPVWENRPLGGDGLGLEPSIRRTEPDPAVRYATDPGPDGADGSDSRWANSSRWATSASKHADYGW
jgi:hypothetical protein